LCEFKFVSAIAAEAVAGRGCPARASGVKASVKFRQVLSSFVKLRQGKRLTLRRNTLEYQLVIGRQGNLPGFRQSGAVEPSTA